MLRGGPSRVEIARSAEKAEASAAAFEVTQREAEDAAEERNREPSERVETDAEDERP